MSTPPRWLTSQLALVALLAQAWALAGCGGGGGVGAAPELRIALASDHVSARYFHGQQTLVNTYLDSPSVGVTGTVDPVPRETVYVRVVFDAPVFETDVGFSVSPPNAFALGFRPVVDLAPGTYTGTITVEVFQDAALTKPYHVTGGTVSYTLVVDPQLTVTVKIDGVVQGEVFTSSHHAVTEFYDSGYGTIYWDEPAPAASWTLHPGQVIELEANLPVAWYGPNRTAGSYGSWFDAPAVTDTTLTETMPDLQGGATGLTGAAFVAMPAGETEQWGAGFTFDLAP